MFRGWPCNTTNAAVATTRRPCFVVRTKYCTSVQYPAERSPVPASRMEGWKAGTYCTYQVKPLNMLTASKRAPVRPWSHASRFCRGTLHWHERYALECWHLARMSRPLRVVALLHMHAPPISFVENLMSCAGRNRRGRDSRS
jgi:hypothetical protein